MKEFWCPAFRKEHFLMRTKSTQRIERMNRNIKSKVSSRITLNELFLRLLSLQEELTNHDLEDQEISTLITHHTLFNGCPILLNIQDLVSPYAYQMTLLQLGDSLSWEMQDNNDSFKLKQNDYLTSVQKVGEEC